MDQNEGPHCSGNSNAQINQASRIASTITDQTTLERLDVVGWGA